MLIKECKFHVSGPRLTQTRSSEVHERAHTPNCTHTNTKRQRFQGSHPHQRADAHTQTTKDLNQPLLSPFVLKDRDKTARESDDLMRVNLKELIIQKLHVHKYVYQYAK